MGAVRDDDRKGKSDATKTTVDRERSAFLLQKNKFERREPLRGRVQ